MLTHFTRATLCESAVFVVVRCLRHRTCLSVSLSVCPSVTLVECIHATEDIVKLFVRPDSPIDTMRRYSFPRGTHSRRAQNTRGWKNWRFSAEIAVYLGNGVR